MRVEITPEWIAAITALMGMSGGFGAWIHARIVARRNSMAIIRASWSNGRGGFAVTVEIVNRLNEDIRVSLVEAKSEFAVPSLVDDGKGGGKTVYNPHASPMPIDWLVEAEGRSKETFRVNGPETARWLRLTMSSSSKTLRCKRVIVRASQMQ